MKQPVLLTFHFPAEKAAKVRLLCMRFAIRFLPVPLEDEGETLAALCGLLPRAGTEAPKEDIPEGMMVMCLFPAGLAQQFLLALHRAKLPPVVLKAVLTETNSAWTPAVLYRELCREREMLGQGRRPLHEYGGDKA